MRLCPLMTFMALLGAAAGCSGSMLTGHSTASWVRQHGGLVEGAAVQRVAAACRRLTADTPCGQVSVFVLASDTVAAHVWPAGEIYVTRGLLDRMDDEELAAAVAHEIGHLLEQNRGFAAVWSLGGAEAASDVEVRADMIGCQLLRSHGLRADAMVRMLEKVRASRCADLSCCKALTRRIESLRPRVAG